MNGTDDAEGRRQLGWGDELIKAEGELRGTEWVNDTEKMMGGELNWHADWGPNELTLVGGAETPTGGTASTSSTAFHGMASSVRPLTIGM
jgi:hypothetical protein